MAYDSFEKSVYGGNPIELFEFARGATEYWRYTSTDTDQTYFGSVYESIAIQHEDFETSQNVEAVELKMTMPLTADFVQMYISAPPSDPISFVLRRFHGGDTEVVSIWVGRVINVEFKEEAVEVICESVYTSLKRPTLRRIFQISCPHVLYNQVDGSCNLDKNNFKVVATLDAVSGTTFTSSTFGAYADGYFAGGFVELDHGGHTNVRYITEHTGNNLELNLQLPEAFAGSSVNAYPGCAHNTSDCDTKFNNILNYGGMPWIPGVNPMGGTRIF